jgi:hypothetical protein
MVHVQSLILALVPFALFACITCHSRSVDSQAARVVGSTECPTPNVNCRCTEDVYQRSMNIQCNDCVTFPVFSPLKLKHTNLNLHVTGTFGKILSECISPLVGEGTVVNLKISGNVQYPYMELQVNSNAFSTNHTKSIAVTFSYYNFSSLPPTEALTVPSIVSAKFTSCLMTVISDNSFYDFSGNELDLLNNGIEEFEQYAFNGTGTLDVVRMWQNPFSQIDPAFKLIRTKELDLSSSNISIIPDYAFCECNMLGGCTNVIHTISLSQNPLVSISDLAFANLPGLSSLSMDTCLLMKIPTIRIQSFIDIDLSNNLITEVEPNSFEGLPHLRRLNLQGNPIIAIQPGAFNSLLWSSLGIFDFDYLTSVDAAITYGLKYVRELIIMNCPKFEEINLNNYSQLPDSLKFIDASSLNIKRVSSNLDFWLQLRYANILIISDNYNYNCTSDIRWMSKYVLCPHEQIVMKNTTCVNTNQPLIAYLQQLEPKPDCIQHSSATFLKNSSKLFMLCILFISFYLFATFN